ncbi:arsenite-resistance protein 2-domain-containing protein [Paraphysoderma sedebokerense]|nr:arsenite-resistance protein 2-domain-containing protein [Paraphysoderma sedebokerense]
MARFDTRIELKMERPSVLSSDITKYGGRDMETEIEKHLENYISKISEAKYKCKICDKLFKEEKYVKKHLSGKHPEKSKKLEIEVQFFNAFVIDPHHLSPREPVLQPQVPAFPYQMPYSAPVGAGFFNSGYPAMGGYMPNSFNPGLPYPVVAQGRNHGGYGRGYGGQGFVPGGAGGVHGGGRGKRFHPYGRKQDGRGGNANLPVDPRQIKSYVDLDAPAEAEVQISYD